MKRFGLLVTLLLGCTLVLVPSDLLEAQTAGSALRGQVVDAEDLAPVEDALVSLLGAGLRAFTDDEGSFAFDEVAPGRYLLVVQRLGFGEGADSVVVREDEDVRLRVRLTPEAIELEPLEVEVPSRAEVERLSRGTGLNVVDREEIEGMMGRDLNLGHVLSSRIPGVSVRQSSGVSGGNFCLEFRRSLDLRRAGVGCHPPLVVVDGTPIFNPTSYLNTVSLEEVQSLEVLPPSEAGTLYGSRAGQAVLLIESRRPWLDAENAERRAARAGISPAYDWDLEERGHPWKRAFAGAAVGTAGTLAGVLMAAGDCSPLNEAKGTECPGFAGDAYAIAAFTLPVLGASVGANLLGRTERSRGEFLRTTFLSTLPMLTGYFFATPQGGRVAFGHQAVFGKVLIAVGVPVVATLADRLFRDVFGGAGEESEGR